MSFNLSIVAAFLFGAVIALHWVVFLMYRRGFMNGGSHDRRL